MSINEVKYEALRGPAQPPISGSGTLVRSLLRHGLLDELKLMIHPILVGSGKRLFEEGEQQTKLELVDSKAFSTGVLYLTYRPTHG